MSGEISRDFARSLSTLHQEVASLKQMVKSQQKLIDEMQKQLDRTDDQAVKHQRSKIRRAVMNGNADDLRHAANSAMNIVDEELVRQAQEEKSNAQFTDIAPIANAIDSTLLQNFIDTFNEEPTVTPVEIVTEPTVVKRVFFAQPAKTLEQKNIEQRVADAHAKFDALQAEAKRQSSNALRRLGPMWRTELD